MKKLQFDIYIGKGMHPRQGEDIVAFVDLPSDVPKGQNGVNGEMIDNTIGFFFLHLLGDYINDWLDFVENENLIKAKIHLNKKSQSRVFTGKEIVNVIKIIASENNRTCTRLFDSILGEVK